METIFREGYRAGRRTRNVPRKIPGWNFRPGIGSEASGSVTSSSEATPCAGISYNVEDRLCPTQRLEHGGRIKRSQRRGCRKLSGRTIPRARRGAAAGVIGWRKELSRHELSSPPIEPSEFNIMDNISGDPHNANNLNLPLCPGGARGPAGRAARDKAGSEQKIAWPAEKSAALAWLNTSGHR
ncbi:hypothetical protein KM043_010199 [Ampulex compressa]|nr:hypothetical protein KM043_010199 [Ampulex compressa]